MIHDFKRNFVRGLLQKMQPQAVLGIDGLREDRKIVALTIDDSPSAETGRILDLLVEYKATATFFIHGDGIRNEEHEKIVHRILDEGHEVGNHMPVSVPSISLRPDVFAGEFERNHDILTKLGVRPVRFRPSHGFHNRTMSEFISKRGVELGYLPVFYLGLHFPLDVFFDIPEWYARHTARAALPGRIVVFHDNQERRDLRGRVINQSRRTLAALPTFFAGLGKQGFKAASLAMVEGAVRA